MADSLDRAIAAQELLLAGHDEDAFQLACSIEQAAAHELTKQRLDLAKPPISVALGMIIQGCLLMRGQFIESQLPNISKTVQVMVDDAIVRGPEQTH